MRRIYILERMPLSATDKRERWTLVVPNGSRILKLWHWLPERLSWRLAPAIESARLGNDLNYSRIWFGF